jgi:hypothetical protein
MEEWKVNEETRLIGLAAVVCVGVRNMNNG